MTEIISVIIGALITYVFMLKLEENKIDNNARTSAILVRNWLMESSDNIVQLKEEMKNRYELLGKNPIDNITVTQNFIELKCLYELDIKLLENISLRRNKFEKYEKTLQMLSLVVQKTAKAEEIKKKFNYSKQMFLIDPIINASKTNQKNSDEIMKDFLGHFKTSLPDWIKLLEKSEKDIKKVYDNFQKNICTPLAIKNVPLSEIIEQDEII